MKSFDDRCQHCLYAFTIKGKITLECRRYAPKEFAIAPEMTMNKFATRWGIFPEVTKYHWCGEYVKERN